MTNLPELTELCRLIGCSGLDPDMCKNNPQKCSIIRKLTVKEGKSMTLPKIKDAEIAEWKRVASEQAKLHDDDCREKDTLKKRIKELEDDIAKYKAFWDDSRLTDKMRWEKYDWPKHSEALMTIKDGKDE